MRSEPMKLYPTNHVREMMQLRGIEEMGRADPQVTIPAGEIVKREGDVVNIRCQKTVFVVDLKKKTLITAVTMSAEDNPLNRSRRKSAQHPKQMQRKRRDRNIEKD